MQKQMEGTKRKWKKCSSLSGKFNKKAETIFALLLSALYSNHHQNPESTRLLNQCLHRLNPSILSQNPNQFLSLFPLILRSKYAKIVTRSLEILGEACLYSLEMNEKIALDDEILRGLINVVGHWKKKKSVTLVACNAILDLSTTSTGRKRLLLLSALECLISRFNQARKCFGRMVFLFSKKKGSITSAVIGFKEDEYLVLLLHAIITLVNSCTIEQLGNISRHMSESSLIYLKSMWAEVHKQMLLHNVLEFSVGSQYYVSKIRPSILVESIFRLSCNVGQLANPSNHMEVKSSIFDIRDISFEDFILNHWEVSPLLFRRPPKSTTNIFCSFEEFSRLGDAFPSFLSPMLKKCISSLPISSDELNVLNFLEEERDHLGCPLIYQQDLRVLKTQNLNRELHFFPEHSGSCFPRGGPHFLYIDDIVKCEEAYQKGYSIALRGMEFRFESIAAIANGLASLFGQPSAGVNMYLTPPNSQGLACHYDDHCVLVCQLIGVKKWTVSPPLNLQLPRLYEPVDSLHDSVDGSIMVDGSTQFFLREGDVLYIPRGFPHEACTSIDTDLDDNAGLSLHLTLAIEVEPPFEWGGFIHVALHHWGQNQYLPEYSSADTLSWNLNVLAVNLIHIAIKKSVINDATFRKACLVGAISLTSVEGSLDVNQRAVFRHLLNTVNTQSGFMDALRDVEVAFHSDKDPLQDIRWLHHANEEREMIEGQNWKSPMIETGVFFHIVGHHLEKAEAAYMHAKSKFCSEVIFKNVEHIYKVLLEKYRMARNQYRNGMLSLHCN